MNAIFSSQNRNLIRILFITTLAVNIYMNQVRYDIICSHLLTLTHTMVR